MKTSLWVHCLLWLLDQYQYHISRDHSWWARVLGLPGYCRFFPSCSQYAREAIIQHGAWRWGWMAFRRVLRCRPGNPGGYDPVCKH